MSSNFCLCFRVILSSLQVMNTSLEHIFKKIYYRPLWYKISPMPPTSLFVSPKPYILFLCNNCNICHKIPEEYILNYSFTSKVLQYSRNINNQNDHKWRCSDFVDSKLFLIKNVLSTLNIPKHNKSKWPVTLTNVQ